MVLLVRSAAFKTSTTNYSAEYTPRERIQTVPCSAKAELATRTNASSSNFIIANLAPQEALVGSSCSLHVNRMSLHSIGEFV